MTEEKPEFDELLGHKRFAVNLFNVTWELLDKTARTKEEDDKMVHCVHASRYHWGEVVAAGVPKTGPENLERGEWQVSRVYAVLGKAEQALYHAQRCLQICEENNIGDWDIAFAYEALARAHAVAGNTAEADKYIQLGKEAGEKIKEKGDKDYFMNTLKEVPGYN